MSNHENVRDTGTCLGGFLGLFLGSMFGFAICTKLIYERIARNDGTVHLNQALLPFLGVLAGGCAGAVVGALVIRLLFWAHTILFNRSADKREAAKDEDGVS